MNLKNIPNKKILGKNMKASYLSQLIKFVIAGSSCIMSSSALKASDLQIYAGPGTGGQKTLMMMLDRSGSMGMLVDNSANNSIVEDYEEFRTANSDGTSTANYSLCSADGADGKTKYKNDETYTDRIFPDVSYTKTYCTTPTTNIRRYDRLTRLKDGMFAMLNSTDSKLKNVYIGLGYYSNNDHLTGVIKVAAAPLGEVNSAHRKALKLAISQITAGWSTPTAHAYAEAASYLMGTNTTNPSFTSLVKQGIEVWTYGGTTAYRTCSSLINNECTTGWSDYIYSTPPLSGYTQYASSISGVWTIQKFANAGENITTTYSAISGFANAVEGAKSGSNYLSPLPTTGASCDGQGIYILSDGQPNNTDNTRSAAIMAKSLNSTSFSCDVSNGLTDSGGGWKCMGAFAKQLYSGVNPKNRVIQTAFVGFGKEFSGTMSESLSNDTRNACRIGSTKAGDACSYFEANGVTVKPSTTYRNAQDGFGNGGFFQVNAASDVTASVLAAIGNIETGTIEPLSTGAWSVPVDNLSPTGLQPYGYVRAFKPNPGSNDVLWAGNLKKYHVVDGVLKTATTSGINIFNASGEFNNQIRDIWGKNANEGGDVYQGGAYANIALPTTSNATVARKFYTNYGLGDDNALTTNLSKNSSLLKIPTTPSNNTFGISYILEQFTNDAVISKFSNSLKRKLLNFLGYDVEISDAALPQASAITVQADNAPWNSFGGISHSLPVQVTYSGTLNADGELQSTRDQSVLFGTMDGGLRLVDASSGSEQFVFIPSDILNDSWQSLALRKTSTNPNGPAYGTDAPWVVDAKYDYDEALDDAGETVTKIKAKSVSIFGGLRMGGSSFYSLDITNPSSPKFKFRVGADQANFNAMGQSWSRPVLANIRYNGQLKRVMVVGGGYDTCYEDPQFALNTNYSTDTSKSETFKTNCSSKAHAKGNAIYVIDADTGERIFWVSNSGADRNNDQMVNSIVSSISTIDTDGDGLMDHMYAADLAGQVFRVDLNNFNQTANLQTYPVRVVRVANLATNMDGTAITAGDAPRFYEAPTLTMHREQGKKFMLIGLVSGDRSSPLDVSPVGRERPETLASVLTSRPTNKVFGIMDTDVLKANINTSYDEALVTKDITMAKLIQNPQVEANTLGLANFIALLQPYVSTISDTTKFGWYRSVSSNAEGTERSGASGIRKSGGIKVFEAPIAIKNTLAITTYDPESNSLGEQDPCQIRVIGETFRQYYCLPFGVCVSNTASGLAINTTAELNTGWRPAKTSEKISNEVITTALGKGIIGGALVDDPNSTGNCGGAQLGGNSSGTGEWACIAQTKPMNWYAK